MVTQLRRYAPPLIAGGVILLVILGLAACGSDDGHDDDNRGSGPVRGTLNVEDRLVEWHDGFSQLWEPIKRIQAVRSDDAIRTDATGHALLTFYEGTEVEIGSGTELVVRDFEQSESGSTVITLEQLKGETLHRVELMADPESRYQIDTPVVQLVVRGTAFQVAVAGNGATHVEVTDGVVQATVEQQTYDIQPGEAFDVTETRQVPRPPYPVSGTAASPDVAPTLPPPTPSLTPTPVNRLAISGLPDKSLIVGEVVRLDYDISNPNNDTLTARATSSDENVVTAVGVTPGTVELTAHSPGTASITVSVDGGRDESSVTLFVVTVVPVAVSAEENTGSWETYRTDEVVFDHPPGWVIYDEIGGLIFTDKQRTLDSILNQELEPDYERMPPGEFVGVIFTLNEPDMTLGAAANYFAERFSNYQWSDPVPVGGNDRLARMTVNGEFNNWVSFLADLGDGWYALVVGTAAPGELAAFESSLLAVAQTARLNR